MHEGALARTRWAHDGAELAGLELHRHAVESAHLAVAPAEQLIDAVRVVHRGDALLSPSVTRRLIEEVTRRPDPSRTPVPGLDELTERELEVLKLVARGLSNSEVAERLFLGEATIKTHLGRVLSKLNLRDRVQAVVLAYESGLVTPGLD